LIRALAVLGVALLVLAAVAAIAETGSGKSGDSAPIRVGILHSETGSLAVSEIPVIDATRMAIDEVNAQGGILGRKIQVYQLNGQSNDAVFARDAHTLIERDKVSVIFGCWTSACRKTLKPIVEQDKNLLMYPLQYEGLEDSPNIVYLGAAPNQQIIPAVKWFLDNRGKRFFLVGSDYIFPHAANAIIRDYLRLYGGKTVGEAYVPLGGENFTAIAQEIKRTRPDVILNTVNGGSNIGLFSALQIAGIKPSRIPVVSFSIAEQEVQEIGARALAGNFAVWNYFASLDNPENRAFIKSFQAEFGQGCLTDDPVEAAYIGVKLWAQAVRDAGTSSPMDVLAKIGSESYRAPEGMVYVDDQNHHLWKTTRIGQIRRDGQFKVVWTSETILHPDPFPASRTEGQWQALLHRFNAKWHGWSAPAVSTNVMGANRCRLM
jgi:urea transport system substrate-binding protein